MNISPQTIGCGSSQPQSSYIPERSIPNLNYGKYETAYHYIYLVPT